MSLLATLLTLRQLLVHHVVMPYPLQDVDMWLVDSLVIPASLHDLEGRFVHVNEAAERASEKTNAQWLGRHFTEPLPPEVRENVAAQFRRAASTASRPTSRPSSSTRADICVACVCSTFLSAPAVRSSAFSFLRSMRAGRRQARSGFCLNRD